jgi:hypothetical protein
MTEKFQNKYRIGSHRKPGWDYSSDGHYFITLVVQNRHEVLGRIENHEMNKKKMNEQQKISIRFFDDREVRALWDEQNAKWWFSVLDIVAVLTDQNDYIKTRNYWKYLKARLKKENSEVVSATTQLKLPVPDGKKRLSDMLDYSGIIA